MARPQQYVQISGDKELNDLFNDLKAPDRKKLIIDSWKVATAPTVDTAKRNLQKKLKPPDNSGHLMQSIGFVPGKFKGNSQFLSAKVGARKFRPFKGYHGHLVEAGTKDRKTKSWGIFNRNGGYKRGRMPATHFFADAVNATDEGIISKTQEQVVIQLDKLIRRHLRAAAKAAK